MIRNVLKAVTWLLFVMLFSVPVSGAEDKWSLEKEEDDIKVYLAATKGSAVKSFRGVVNVDSSLNSVLAVIADTASYPRWVHDCKSAKMVKKVSENEVYNHIVSDMPWPVVDRDSVIRSVKTQNSKTRQVKITFVSKPDLIEKRPKTVRITQMKGLWELTPLENGKLQILYQMSVDPGGSIPKWLVNSLAVDIPYHTLNNLRRIAKEDHYKNASK